MKPETCTTSNTSGTDRDETANVAVVTDAEIKAFRNKYKEIFPGSWPDRVTIIELLTASKQAVAVAGEAFRETLAANMPAPTLPADVTALIRALEDIREDNETSLFASEIETIKKAEAALVAASRLHHEMEQADA